MSYTRVLGGLLSGAAAATILGLMVVSFGDVTARNLARPIAGAYEITEILVGAMVFATLPIVTWRGKHVAVGLLAGFIARSRIASLLATVLSRGVTAAVLLFLGYHLWRLGNQFHARHAGAIFAGIPHAPFAWFASVMCFTSALAAIIRPATEIAGEEI